MEELQLINCVARRIFLRERRSASWPAGIAKRIVGMALVDLPADGHAHHLPAHHGKEIADGEETVIAEAECVIGIVGRRGGIGCGHGSGECRAAGRGFQRNLTFMI